MHRVEVRDDREVSIGKLLIIQQVNGTKRYRPRAKGMALRITVLGNRGHARLASGRKRSQGTIQSRADGSHEQMEEFRSERNKDRRVFRNKKEDAI